MSTNKHRFVSKTILPFASLLLSSVALSVIPAKADAELDALQARLAEAQKENIRLKAERLEQENARLRAETDVFKARSKPSAPVALGAASIRAGKSRSGVSETHTASMGRSATDGVLNAALGNIPKDDHRREMTATAHVIAVSTVSPVVDQWSGVYAGINAGYGAGEVTRWRSNAVEVIIPQFYESSSSSAPLNGPVAGGQIGYNYELSNKAILGIETDFDYADVNDRASGATSSRAIDVLGAYLSTGGSSPQYNNQYARAGLDWVGTTRLRVGYDLGKFVPYLTGGLAYGNLTATTSSSNSDGLNLGNTRNVMSFGENSKFKLGWSAGAGAELKVADNWAIRGEYLFTQLGSLSTRSNTLLSQSYYNTSCCPFSTYIKSVVFPGVSQGSIGPFGIHQVRVGLNYYTGWGASPTLATLR